MRTQCLLALLIGMFCAAVPASAQTHKESSPSEKLRIWFEDPAERWEEALPIGNGRLGAMVFGGPNHERIQLNEDSLWSGKYSDRVNPEALKNLPAIRKLLQAG